MKLPCKLQRYGSPAATTMHFLQAVWPQPKKRRPLLAAACRQIEAWAGPAVADRVCSTNEAAVLSGLPLRLPEPRPARRWLSWLA